ncbi:hypothetical protein BEL04_04630 [Mucilaginibacter sp. PPCGB 2223]|nr:hypothetical protein BEL04_04630 [Mucilaginibacter sp. PPCGB 2223]
MVKEIELKKEYKFMYENFIISSQHELYLLLEESNGIIDALKFNFSIYKYGYPNDEALGAHPLAKFGLKWYSFFEVENSPWIEELKVANRVHHRHEDSLYKDRKHYTVTFKDVTLDVITSSPFEVVELTRNDIIRFVNEQIDYLNVD